MDNSSSFPDRQTQLEDARQRGYRSSRRASLTASWSEEGLDALHMDSPSPRRRLSEAPTSPLPPVPSPRPSASLSPTRALPPIPSPRPALAGPRSQPPPLPPRMSHEVIVPPLPPRILHDAAMPPLLPPRASHEAALPLLPPRPSHDAALPPLPPRASYEIAVPPPAVLPAVGPQDPTAGTFEAQVETPLAMHPQTHIDYSDASAAADDVPRPVHHSGLHHASASLPENTVREPPALPLTPRPPLATRAQTHHYTATGDADSSSGSDGGLDAASQYMAARALSTPSAAVRHVAIVDAQRNSDAMFSDRVLNFRDLGASVTKSALALDKDRVRAEHEGPLPGVVFRSAELGSADERDVRMLFSRYGIRTIIDLRSELEARASDIMMRHYPASIQPTADQSIDKLMRLRAEQVRQTIIEVAAHDYESAARPWEKTGESKASWSHRNSLRYTRSIGDPRKDALARALVHLYDDDADAAAETATQNISAATPYVPQAVVPPEELVAAETLDQDQDQDQSQDQKQDQAEDHGQSSVSSAAPVARSVVTTANDTVVGDQPEAEKVEEVEADEEADEEAVEEPPQHVTPSFAQSAFDWGSDTLQSLRSYWDQQWVSGVTQTPVMGHSDTDVGVESAHRPSSVASDRSWSSADSFYNNLETDANRHPSTAYGLRPVTAAAASPDVPHSPPLLTPRIVIVDGDASSETKSYAGSPRSLPRALTESAAVDGSVHRSHSHSHRDGRSHSHGHSRSNSKSHGRSHSKTHGRSHSRSHRRSHSRSHRRSHSRSHRRSHSRSHNRSHSQDQDHDHNHRHSHTHGRGRGSFSSPRLYRGDNADETAESSPLSPSPASPTARLVVTNRFDGNRRRYRCNVIGDNYRKKCVWASTPWSTRIKVIWRFATFNKAEAIRTIGREVLAPRGLAGSYEDYVDYCKEEFAQVMRIFADPAAYPVLFHCQHGKDRTGIVAMLLLGILDVDDDVIAADYALSQANLAPVRTRMELLDMGAVGLPPSFCDAPAAVMLNLLRHIRVNYGGVRGYLRAAGLQEQEINTIAWCLRGNFCAIARASQRQARQDARRVYLRPSAARSDIFDRRSDNTLAL